MKKEPAKLEFSELLSMIKLFSYIPLDISVPKIRKMVEDFDEIYYKGGLDRSEIRDVVRWVRILKHEGKVFAMDRKNIETAMEGFREDERIAIGEWLLLSTRKP